LFESYALPSGANIGEASGKANFLILGLQWLHVDVKELIERKLAL